MGMVLMSHVFFLAVTRYPTGIDSAHRNVDMIPVLLSRKLTFGKNWFHVSAPTLKFMSGISAR